MMDCGPGLPVTLAVDIDFHQIFNKYKFNIVKAYNMRNIATPIIMELYGEYPAFER